MEFFKCYFAAESSAKCEMWRVLKMWTYALDKISELPNVRTPVCQSLLPHSWKYWIFMCFLSFNWTVTIFTLCLLYWHSTNSIMIQWSLTHITHKHLTFFVFLRRENFIGKQEPEYSMCYCKKTKRQYLEKLNTTDVTT